MTRNHDRPAPPPDNCCRTEPGRPASPGPKERALVQRLIDSLDRPGERIQRIALGGFFVGVLAGDRLGLAATLGARFHEEDRAALEALPGARLDEAAANIFSASPLSVSLGLAALNAGLAPPRLERGPNVEEIIADWGRDRRVVVVGDFPFTERLRGSAARLDLLELKDTPGRTEREEWDRVLAGCHVAAITSTALLTRAMAYFLERSAQAQRILVGPSTPLSPVFFQEGAAALAGSVVTDPEAVLAGIEEGLNFRGLKKLGIRFVFLRPGDLN